jgi:hypothetical protein
MFVGTLSAKMLPSSLWETNQVGTMLRFGWKKFFFVKKQKVWVFFS